MILLADKHNRVYAGWYSSPLMSQEGFGDTIRRLCTDYDTQIVFGDINARHPRWSIAHDRFKLGARLLRLTHELSQLIIHAPAVPTFTATRNRETGTLRSSTVDLLISSVPVPRLDNLCGFVIVCSDHRPITFTLGANIDKIEPRRRVSKTILQSTKLKQEIGLLYAVSLHEPRNTLEKVTTRPTDESHTDFDEQTQTTYNTTKEALTSPWTYHVKKQRRGSAPHVTVELRQLWTRKKLLYDRFQWRPTRANHAKYK